jgi:hypothetical protein
MYGTTCSYYFIVVFSRAISQFSDFEAITSCRSNVDEWPIDTLVLRTGISKSSASVKTDRVILCSSQVLQIDALFCMRCQLCSIPTDNLGLRGLEATRAILPSAITFHC